MGCHLNFIFCLHTHFTHHFDDDRFREASWNSDCEKCKSNGHLLSALCSSNSCISTTSAFHWKTFAIVMCLQTDHCWVIFHLCAKRAILYWFSCSVTFSRKDRGHWLFWKVIFEKKKWHVTTHFVIKTTLCNTYRTL